MSATGFVTAFLLGLCILIVGFSFSDPLLYIMGATETILPYAREYMRIILIGAPYMTASLVLNNQMRFQGSAFLFDGGNRLGCCHQHWIGPSVYLCL